MCYLGKLLWFVLLFSICLSVSLDELILVCLFCLLCKSKLYHEKCDVSKSCIFLFMMKIS